MIRNASPAALTFVFMLALTAAAWGADRNVSVTFSGRSLDRLGAVALDHAGILYIDVADAIRAFDGLITFDGEIVTVSIGDNVAIFKVGSDRANLNGRLVPEGGPPFRRSGEVYVPLIFLATSVGSAHVVIPASHTSVKIVRGRKAAGE